MSTDAPNPDRRDPEEEPTRVQPSAGDEPTRAQPSTGDEPTRIDATRVDAASVDPASGGSAAEPGGAPLVQPARPEAEDTVDPALVSAQPSSVDSSAHQDSAQHAREIPVSHGAAGASYAGSGSWHWIGPGAPNPGGPVGPAAVGSHGAVPMAHGAVPMVHGAGPGGTGATAAPGGRVPLRHRITRGVGLLLVAGGVVVAGLVATVALMGLHIADQDRMLESGPGGGDPGWSEHDAGGGPGGWGPGGEDGPGGDEMREGGRGDGGAPQDRDPRDRGWQDGQGQDQDLDGQGQDGQGQGDADGLSTAESSSRT